MRHRQGAGLVQRCSCGRQVGGSPTDQARSRGRAYTRLAGYPVKRSGYSRHHLTGFGLTGNTLSVSVCEITFNQSSPWRTPAGPAHRLRQAGAPIRCSRPRGWIEWQGSPVGGNGRPSLRRPCRRKRRNASRVALRPGWSARCSWNRMLGRGRAISRYPKSACRLRQDQAGPGVLAARAACVGALPHPCPGSPARLPGEAVRGRPGTAGALSAGCRASAEALVCC